MNISEHLKNKSFTFKEKPKSILFDIDWEWVREHNRCPICMSKLYDSRKFPDSIICKSKTHKFFKIKKFNT